MKKVVILILLFVVSLPGFAQNISVTFSGTGASTVIDTVKATNLTTNQSVTLPGHETLVLTMSSGTATIPDEGFSARVYPNPFPGHATFSATINKSELLHVKIQDLVGRVVTETSTRVGSGTHDFELSIANPGIYTVTMSTSNGMAGYKVICTRGGSRGNAIRYAGLSGTSSDLSSVTGLKKSATSYTLGYTLGDIILYKCTRATLTTILADSPSASGNYEVDFTFCTDHHGRNYPVVTMGNQTWMAENLAFLPAVSPSSTGLGTLKNYYVYGYEGTNVDTARNLPNYKTYGVLYNWTSAIDACPPGWHLPDEEEWKTLEQHFGMSPDEIDGVSFRFSGSVGKKLKSSDGWLFNGNGSNSSGFSALPGGIRAWYGGFFGAGLHAYFCSATAYNDSLNWYRGLVESGNGEGVNRNTYEKKTGYSVRCIRGVVIPVVTTAEVTNITKVSAIGEGEVASDGGSRVIERGICLSTSEKPTIADTKSISGSGKGPFAASLTGLSPGMTYFVRAYAINSAGTAYGNEVVFKTILEVVLPTVVTTDISDITESTAKGGGQIVSDGGAPVTARGVCWNITGNPTVMDSITLDGSGTGTFTSSLTGLSQGTPYFVRAYATNSAGTAYGEQKQFKTAVICIDGLFTDSRDGREYAYKTIGTQTWMAQNLNFATTKGSWCYNSLAANCDTYGRLYSWSIAQADSLGNGQDVCPPGWHLPTDAEWTILTDFLGSKPGGKMKETGTAHWLDPNTGATNESCFTALPGGYRNGAGDFIELHGNAYFWSSTIVSYSPEFVWCRRLYYYGDGVNSWGMGKDGSHSVRCIKNE